MLIKQKNISKNPIINAKDVAEIITTILTKERLCNQNKEHWWIIGINNANIVSYVDLISRLVHPRETYRLAILKEVSNIICVHNHPSGEMKPSEADLLLTEHLIKSGNIINIKLLDHVIIDNLGNFISLRDEGYFTFQNL